VASNPGLHVHLATATDFYAEDVTDDRFFISGSLYGGILRFTVRTVLPIGDRSALSGRFLFDYMMGHFSAQSATVTAVEGEWSTFDPMFRSNIDEFNRQTAAGCSETDAARRAWTGKMAVRHGYANVEIVYALPAGARGKYQEVLVRFRQ
jgi:hypothetical protein